MPGSIPFAKYHGLGNDFLVVAGEGLPRPLTGFARAILDRHRGVGADGLLVLAAARTRKHDARLRVFNADGSEAEMSGNGIRCVGAFLAELFPTRRTFLIETLAGLRSLERVNQQTGKWQFRVGMGAPVLEPAKIPFKAEAFAAPIKGFPLRLRSATLPVTVTSMGNPHCSLFVQAFEDAAHFAAWLAAGPAPEARAASDFSPEGAAPTGGAASFDWRSVGREVETNRHFPNRTNVEFVRVISRTEIEVRFWERGVGHTMSSGTGSCAAAVASILNGLTNRQVRVRTQAGSLEVAWPENGEVTLTGPVERVGRGTYDCVSRSA